VAVTNACTLNLAGGGTTYTTTNPAIANVINDVVGVGGPTWTTTRVYVLYYCNPIEGAPTFSVPSGLYNAAQTVTITAPIDPDTGAPYTGVSIYYTTDGTTPTQSSTLYTGPISVGTLNQMTTLTAIAFKGNGNSDPATDIISVLANPAQKTGNLALFSPVYANADPGGNAYQLTNGAGTGSWSSTNWSPGVGNSDPTAQSWLVIDLGATYTLTQVKIYWEDNAACPANVQLAMAPSAATWPSNSTSPWTGTTTNTTTHLADLVTGWGAIMATGTEPTSTIYNTGGAYAPLTQTYGSGASTGCTAFTAGTTTGRYLLINMAGSGGWGIQAAQVQATGTYVGP
jgi:hypothetical protein